MLTSAPTRPAHTAASREHPSSTTPGTSGGWQTENLPGQTPRLAVAGALPDECCPPRGADVCPRPGMSEVPGELSHLPWGGLDVVAHEVFTVRGHLLAGLCGGRLHAPQPHMCTPSRVCTRTGSTRQPPSRSAPPCFTQGPAISVAAALCLPSSVPSPGPCSASPGFLRFSKTRSNRLLLCPWGWGGPDGVAFTAASHSVTVARGDPVSCSESS